MATWSTRRSAAGAWKAGRWGSWALALLVMWLVAASVHAQQALRRIGFLSGGSSSNSAPFVGAFGDGLRDLGWIEGRNVSIDYRFAEGRFDRLPELAAELVQRKVDLIVAVPTPAALAAKQATATLPIVIVSVPSPTDIGLVATLARPGGNVTGVSFSVGIDSIGKQLQLLQEAAPRARRVAMLLNPANPGHALAQDRIRADAQSLGLTLHVVEARTPEDFDRAFATMAKERVDGLLVVADSMFAAHRHRLAQLAINGRLPSVYAFREYADAGGLLSFGPNLVSQYRQAASYVDKIFRGAAPGELPVEQPSKFELVINLRTAKALGLPMPRPLLLQASQVIE